MLTQAYEETSTQFNRVPKVTVDFWLIKLMAVTMGETAADYLAVNMGLGLTTTSLIMSSILLVAVFLQFAQKKYVPWAYWLAVVLISIVGTLITDNLVDNFGVPLITTTIVFSIALLATFALWYAYEKTLSIHTIFTTRREVYYWLAILFTFALGIQSCGKFRRASERRVAPGFAQLTHWHTRHTFDDRISLDICVRKISGGQQDAVAIDRIITVNAFDHRCWFSINDIHMNSGGVSLSYAANFLNPRVSVKRGGNTFTQSRIQQ